MLISCLYFPIRILQYPGEDEVTLTPFTALETNGKARVEHTPNGEIVYFPLKVLP